MKNWNTMKWSVTSVGIFVVFLGRLCVGKSEQVACRQGFFRKVEKSYGLSRERVVGSHFVPSWFDCSVLCLEHHKTCAEFSFLIQFTGSVEPNCYLVGKVLQELAQVDLNNDFAIYETGNKNVWETYTFIHIESEVCLEEQACQNDGACLVDSCEPEGYRCACDELHHGKRCELGINDFDLQFPAATEQNNSSYVLVKDAIKSDLTQFTFTTWFKIDVGLPRYHLFTYIVNSVVHIQLYFQSISGAFYAKISSHRRGCNVQPLNDNVWHHFAYVIGEGQWNAFIDGKIVSIKEHFPIVIPKGGMVYIGNYVPNLETSEDGMEFVGELSRLHLWDRILTGEEVERTSRSPTNDVGNVLSWFKLVGHIFGNVEMIKPSTAVNTEVHFLFQIRIDATDKGYISWPTSFKQLDGLSVCLWLKTRMETVYVSRGSKDNDRHFAFGVNSDKFMFALINGIEINSTLHDPNLANGRWHFLCVTWDGKSGEIRFFFEGIMLGETRKQDGLKAILPKAGNFSAGVDWINNCTSQLVDGGICGSLAYLNVWSVALNRGTITSMSAGGLNVNGDVMSWKYIPKWIVGHVHVRRKNFVFFPGYSALKEMSEWCKENLSSSLCQGPLYARLGQNKEGSGMEWRCYCVDALLHSRVAYDFSKRSPDYFSEHRPLSQILFKHYGMVH